MLDNSIKISGPLPFGTKQSIKGKKSQIKSMKKKISLAGQL